MDAVLEVFKGNLQKNFVDNFEPIQHSSLLFLIATFCKYLLVIRVCLGYSQWTERHG